MNANARKRPFGATILAIALAWLGLAGVLNAIGWPLLRHSELMKSAPPELLEQFPPVLGSTWLSVLAFAYGLSALVAARAVWRLSSTALTSYSVWAVTVLVLAVWLAGTAGFPLSTVVAFVLPAIALLAAGWLFTRRLVQA